MTKYFHIATFQQHPADIQASIRNREVWTILGPISVEGILTIGCIEERIVPVGILILDQEFLIVTFERTEDNRIRLIRLAKKIGLGGHEQLTPEHDIFVLNHEDEEVRKIMGTVQEWLNTIPTTIYVERPGVH